MTALYRAYCRSCTRVACAPWAVVLAVVLMLMFAVGAGQPVMAHRAAILAGLRDAAAAALAVSACGLLLAMAARVARYTGNHCDTVPEPVKAAEPVTEPATAPMAVSGYHPAYTLRPEQAAQMEAEADALADDETVVTVASLTGAEDA